MAINSAAEYKEQMKRDLQVQLPMPIDTKRYLIGIIAWKDLAIIFPFALLTVVLMVTFYNLKVFNQWTFFISATPTVLISVLQFTKHKIRKEISFLKYGVLWKYQFKKREKEFFYRKGALNMADAQDTRRKLGVKTVFADCYETSDSRLVRVFEVSSINLSLSNKTEKRSVIDAFKVFMNTINFLKTIQFSQIAQPINLARHIRFVTEKNKTESNDVKRMLIKSYTNEIESIQNSRDLVTRKRYAIISQKIGADRDKALDELDQKSQLLISKIENMSFDYQSLKASQLNNDDLKKLLFTCIDYDSAVALGSHIINRTNNRSDITVGEDSARELIETLTKQLNERVS